MMRGIRMKIQGLINREGEMDMSNLKINKKVEDKNMRRSMISTMFVMLIVFTGAVFISVDTHAIVSKVIKEIAEEVFEYAFKKGGKEFAEGLGKKVGKEAMEEITEKAMREAGEAGAKKLMRELSEQAVKYGDDMFLVARKYGVSHTTTMLRGLSKETGEKAVKVLLNRGDDLMPLVNRFGQEVLEVEVRHPGLTPKLVQEFGENGLRMAKNLTTPQVRTLAKRSDILECLTEEGKKKLCEEVSKPGIGTQILDIFEKHPKTTEALWKLSAILGVTYITADKLGRSEVNVQLPDGRIVKDKVSIFDRKRDISGVYSLGEQGMFDRIGNGIYMLCIILGIGVGSYFVIKGATPIIVAYRRKKLESKTLDV